MVVCSFKYINLKESQDEEEVQYVACWLENEIWDKKIRVYKMEKEVKRKRGKP